MDKIVDKIAALGIPGLVLVVAVATTGLAGGAAVVAALALLGGPLGMLGGIAVLGILVLISKALTTYGFEKIFEGVVLKLLAPPPAGKGLSRQEISNKIEGYPISKELKRKLREMLG